MPERTWTQRPHLVESGETHARAEAILAALPRTDRQAPHAPDAAASPAGLGAALRVPSPTTVLHLQRFAGNQRVTALLTGVAPTAIPPEASVQRTGLVGEMNRVSRKSKAMAAALNGSTQGRHALDVQGTYDIGVEWTDKGAASFDGSSNRVFLNDKLDAQVLAGYFIHEMYHAEQLKSGASPDADVSPDEKEYVDRMVGRRDRRHNPSVRSETGTKGPLMPQEGRYRSAYAYWKKKSLGEGADGPAADAKRREMARRMVAHLIGPQDRSSRQLAPNQFETYEMYCRRLWKQAAPKRARQP